MGRPTVFISGSLGIPFFDLAAISAAMAFRIVLRALTCSLFVKSRSLWAARKKRRTRSSSVGTSN
jgi:hypothetical protein